MKLRTRLIIAFLLLSVVPLSAVTFVTYRSWIATFESAAQREASQSALDIGRRMERITAEVGRRMDRMFVAPPASADSTGRTPAMRERVAPMLGDAASLVERVEFHPAPGALAAATPPSPPPPWIGPDGRPRFPPPPGAPPWTRGGPGGRGGRGGRSGPRGEGPPTPPTPPEVIVVDVEQAIEEARKLARTEVAAAAPSLTPLVEAATG